MTSNIKHIIMLNNNTLNSPPSKYQLKIHKRPYSSTNSNYILTFQWIITCYFFYFFLSIAWSGEPYQLRIVIYSIIFMVFQSLKVTYNYALIEDPLRLSYINKIIKSLICLCIVNLVILLFRIIYINHNLHSLIMLIHLITIIAILCYDSLKLKQNTQIVTDIGSFNKLLTPILLFIFNKTSDQKFSQISIIQFCLLFSNLIGTIQIKKILCLKQCNIFGWVVIDEEGKSHMNWNRKRALRSIIVGACILIVTQNLMLIFQKIKYLASVTIIHTFVIALSTYFLFSTKKVIL